MIPQPREKVMKEVNHEKMQKKRVKKQFYLKKLNVN